MTGRGRARHRSLIARRKKKDDEVRGAGRASSAGIEMAIAIVGCMLLGWWADEKLDTGPWLTLLGLVLGSFIGFRSLWQAAQAANEMNDEDE